MERQFQQRQRELEQPQQQQLRSRGSFLKMMMSEVLFSVAQLDRAYRDCRKHKRNTPAALHFELQAEAHLCQLQRELLERSFHPSTSDCFVTQAPKLREIFAADFRDRITHHLLVRYLERVWEPSFIYDSYASRPGKGIHLAVARLQGFTRQVTQNATRPAWYLQLDIKNFFMTINKQILFDLIAARCHNEDMRWLAQTLIFHDPTADYWLKSSRRLLHRIPRQKSLFGVGPECGLPIGNLTSQFFANVYLNGLDQFVKHTLKGRWYLRYVDDFVLLHADREQLQAWQEQIAGYLQTQLALTLNQARTKLRPIRNGIDFLGYIVRPAYVLCRNRVVNNLKAKLRAFEAQLIRVHDGITTIRYDAETLGNLFACLNSYLGHFQHADTFTLTRRLFAAQAWLKYYVTYKNGQLKRRYVTPRSFRNLRVQYAYFANRRAGGLLFFQVGCFYEFYGRQAITAHKLLNLKYISRKYGFLRRCGVGVKALARYVDVALQQGVPVTVVNQTGYVLRNGLERTVAVRYVPCGVSMGVKKES